MMRLPLVVAGLAAAAAIVAGSNGALGEINTAFDSLTGSGNKGPLIIQIQRSSSLSDGASEMVKQTRCLLLWGPGSGGERGKYSKQCSTSQLPR